MRAGRVLRGRCAELRSFETKFATLSSWKVSQSCVYTGLDTGVHGVTEVFCVLEVLGRVL